MGTLLLAGLAGILASLSPCVLPLLPIVLGAATAEHRLAPLALAGGLVIGFAGLGVVLGLLATSIGFDPEVLRIGSAVMLLLAGLALLVAGLATRLTMAGEAIMAPISALAQRMPAQGLGGQFGLGVVLGVAWAPCTGPALGAALGLAAQAGTAAQATLVMAAFALGAALPLLALGTVARSAMPALRRHLAKAGGWGRPALGGVLALVGVAMLSGLDRRVEAVLTAALPDGWVELITRF
ncbi:MAG: sulfite exporter TauE/SafE family protein [Roseococcus sp.]|jgi:cytochrome c biogenesis protein CcdA|nr:sulfite exporter TauE/SafE family protein [Roseococcus sp.]